MRISLCIGLLLVASMNAQKQYDTKQSDSLALIGTTAVQKPIGCNDNLSVERTANHWYVKNLDTGTSHFVQKADVDKQIRNISPEQFAGLVKSGKGYVALNQCDDGSYTLQHRARMRGGGPWTAYLLYGATKGAAYGTIATAATAGATAAAGPAGAGVAASAANAAGATAGSVGGAAGAGAGAAAGTALGASGATTASGAMVAASGGCLATLTAGIESAAWGAAAVGMWLPTP